MVKLADQIRNHAAMHYIQPARSKGDTHICICAKDVHRQMKLSHRERAVCGALRAIKFQKTQRLKRITEVGPPNGANTVFIFEILN